MNQIKPRYRLGSQSMLDAAVDDARKLDCRAVFRIKAECGTFNPGDMVVRRYGGPDVDDYERAILVKTVSRMFGDARSQVMGQVGIEDLKPLI